MGQLVSLIRAKSQHNYSSISLPNSSMPRASQGLSHQHHSPLVHPKLLKQSQLRLSARVIDNGQLLEAFPASIKNPTCGGALCDLLSNH